MQTIDIEIPDEQAPREATAQLIEEGLRHAEFPVIEFRDSEAGRQAFVVGSTLAVWEVLMVAESYGLDAERTAIHLRWPVYRVQDALAYAKAYPDQTSLELAENRAVTEEELRRSLPKASWV